MSKFESKTSLHVRFKELHTFEVAGTIYNVDSRESKFALFARLEQGREVEIRREPDNSHDENACAIYFGNSKIGYIPRELAMEIALAFRHHRTFDFET